jgi:chromosomal replication initiator protein
VEGLTLRRTNRTLGRESPLSDRSPQRLWETALGQLQVQVTRPNYDTWLRDTVGLRLEPHALTVGVPSDFALEWLRTRMGGSISRTVSQIAGDGVAVQFEVLGATLPSSHDEHPTAQSKSEVPPAHFGIRPDHRHTFDTLAVVKSNRLAARAIRRFVDDKNAPQVLVLHSRPALGKSHLLHAAANAAKAQDLRSALMSGEWFVRHFGAAVRSGKPHTFSAQFQGLQVLLIDDLQFLAARKGSQEQFFHIFQTLYNDGCRMALTLDAAPSDVPGLAPRLLSRLSGGLCVEIHQPDADERLEILRAKAPELPESALRTISAYPSQHVSELEGVLHRVLAYTDLTGKQPSPIAINDALHPFQSERASPDHRRIIEAICSRFNVPAEDLSGPSRSREITYARHLAMYLIHKRSQLPYAEIGRLFGNRDHTTVLSGCRRIAKELNALPSTKKDVEALDLYLIGPAA